MTFYNHFDFCFNWLFDFIFRKIVWMNFEIENISKCVDFSNITFLWKKHCFERWIIKFRDFFISFFKSRIRIERYFWILTRNVASCFVIIITSFSLYRNFQFAYIKIYVLFKQQFSIFIKNIKSFANFMFELLNYHFNQIVRWYEINKKNSNVYIDFVENFQKFIRDFRRV